MISSALNTKFEIVQDEPKESHLPTSLLHAQAEQSINPIIMEAVKEPPYVMWTNIGI